LTAVALVELVDELLARAQPAQAGAPIIKRGPELLPVRIWRGDPHAVGELNW